MNGKKPGNSYSAMLRHRNWGAWAAAAGAGVFLNLALFALVPYLLTPDPDPPEYEQLVSQVNVIRMQEPEVEEPEPIEEPEEEPEEEKPEPDETAAPRQPVETEMTLPFDINPRLPSGPQSLEFPEMMRPGPPSAGDTFSSGDLDEPLTAVSRMPPVYPMNAKRRNIEGWVRVRFVVDEDGEVDDVTILDEDPPGVFDRAVIDCVSDWRFRPGTVGGVPVRSAAETTIRFELD